MASEEAQICDTHFLKGVGVADLELFRKVFLYKLAELISQKLLYLEEQLFAIILNLTVI
jgi:hypothetical protein